MSRSVTCLAHDMFFRDHHLEVASFGWSGEQGHVAFPQEPPTPRKINNGYRTFWIN
ncbi:hypothetical protein VCRA2119O147_1750002 [Vibrio crassostreae]|uniref:Uncharacterized protein n=2 Tax=Vibrio TaxID=662 RepID=A0AA86XUT0_9VIBR|nr:conserved hypothetical protein [Vibrio chagasii]CAK1934476.1 hypothetical protein VCRA2113O322_210023 [Vibrio crassostreae]CDT86726.1 hypothetical protein VCR31J2_1370033 [Vibrio coralliirubri]CAH6873623.1 conserved hypothetical protein [Vibrio chagasii]CAH6892371.1 conserved hypothetical protein [Vibrio chagasii]